MQEKFIVFGDRLRQIRKEMGLSQEEFAKKLGTSKQVLSRYETKQRAPKISIIADYAKRLEVPVEYMLGDTEQEAYFYQLCPQVKDKPFHQIFLDVTAEMGLDIPGIVRVTGLTDSQVRILIFKKLKEAPLPLALLLTDTLGVPLEVWTGGMEYIPADISIEAREVARAYDKADDKSREIARTALDLMPVRKKKDK